MSKNDISQIDGLVQEMQKRLDGLDSERVILVSKIEELRKDREDVLIGLQASSSFLDAPVRQDSSSEEKIALFRSLFRGREEVYPRRWENLKTGKSGWQPACENEWARGICDKQHIKCGECLNRELLPVKDEVIRNHLTGYDVDKDSNRRLQRDFTIGVYPLLNDDPC